MPRLKDHYPLSIESLEVRQMLDSEMFSATLPPTPTDFGPIFLSLQQFDTQGGYRILDQIDLMADLKMSTSTSGSLTNSGASLATYRAQVSGDSTATGPGLTGLLSMVATDTGVINVPGNSMVMVPPTMDMDPQMESHTFLDAATLALFTGISEMNYTFNGLAGSTISIIGGGNLSQNVTIATASEGSVKVTYTFHLATPNVNIVKLTNGTDNNSPTGPNIPVGGPVTWTYQVTNPGNVQLDMVTVVDNQAGVVPAFVSGDTDMDGRLDTDETWIYTAAGTAIPGQYANKGTVTGRPVDENGVPIMNPNVPATVMDMDLDHYFGVVTPHARIKINPNGVNGVGDSHVFVACLDIDDGLPANMFGGDAFNGFAPAAGRTVTVTLDGTNGAIPDISAPVNLPAADPSSITGVTAANGRFSVTFSSANAGLVFGNAFYSGVEGTVDTDPSTPASPDTTGVRTNGPSIKRFVDANITIAPDGTNPVGAPHTFTVTVRQDDGLTAAEGGDGFTGFKVVNAAKVTQNLVGTIGAIPDIIAPSDLAPANPSMIMGLTNASGEYAVTFTSAVAGTVTGNGTVMFMLDGVNLVRDTDPATAAIGAGPGGSGPAIKTFIPSGGHTATIGFWNNKNGLAVIQSSAGTNLSNWLATNFPNLYASLAGASNTQVYNFFRSATNSYFNATPGPKTNAQVMAVALAVYFSDVSNTATAQQFGFDAPIGGTIVSVNGNASAFTGYLQPGGTTISINNMLAAANFYAVNGVIHGGSGSNWIKINNQFAFVNVTFDIL